MGYARKKYKRSKKKKSYKYKISKYVQMHHFKRTVSISPFTAATTNGQITFDLADLDNSTDFSALFDQYKINAIKLVFMPTMNVAIDGQAPTNTIPLLRCVEDNDGGGSTTWSVLGEQKHTDLYLDRPRSFTITNPSVQTEIYRGVATTAYAPKSKQWLDMITTDVPHYGFKYALYYTPSTNWKCPIEATYYMSFKGVR